jgi:hypothetical protein
MKLFRLPSPAMVVALGALVMSVGGNVTAAALITSAGIKDNTIRSADVRDGTLTSVDVRNGALAGADVKDGALKGVDVANNTLTGADVKESSLGQVPSAANATSAKNAGTVDGMDANALTRVATISTDDTLALTLQYQTYGTPLTITAPKSGFVMIHGSTTFVNKGCTTGCGVNALVRHIQSGATSVLAQESISAGQFFYANTSHAYVFPVMAGVNTFDVRVARESGNGTLQGYFGELAAIYVPFGSTGTGPVD